MRATLGLSAVACGPLNGTDGSLFLVCGVQRCPEAKGDEGSIIVAAIS